MPKISIIGVPMDLGADRRGVDMGPSALRYADLNERLQALDYDVQDLGDLDVIIPETRHFGDPKAKYLKEIADACTHLANLILEILEEAGRRLCSEATTRSQWALFPAWRRASAVTVGRLASCGLMLMRISTPPKFRPAATYMGCRWRRSWGMAPSS